MWRLQQHWTVSARPWRVLHGPSPSQIDHQFLVVAFQAVVSCNGTCSVCLVWEEAASRSTGRPLGSIGSPNISTPANLSTTKYSVYLWITEKSGDRGNR